MTEHEYRVVLTPSVSAYEVVNVLSEVGEELCKLDKLPYRGYGET